jgi:hypothetical protein
VWDRVEVGVGVSIGVEELPVLLVTDELGGECTIEMFGSRGSKPRTLTPIAERSRRGYGAM